jgi:D-alanyl-D-alanine dipeptidase
MSKLKNHFSILNHIEPKIIYRIDYATNDNFTGSKVPGYEQKLAILTNKCIDHLLKAQSLFQVDGFNIIIFDAYRPMKAVSYFLNTWSKEADNLDIKQKYFPTHTKNELFEKGYLSKKSSHCRGSTVDIGLVDSKNNQLIDFGTIFDFFGTESHTEFQDINKEFKDMRKYLCNIMAQCGFRNYHKEWWHFTLIDEPNTENYYDFNIKENFYE